MLRVQQEEFEREKIAALQAQLEEAHKTRSQLDTDNRSTQIILFQPKINLSPCLMW